MVFKVVVIVASETGHSRSMQNVSYRANIHVGLKPHLKANVRQLQILLNINIWSDTFRCIEEVTPDITMWRAFTQPCIVAVLFNDLPHNTIGHHKCPSNH
jgi:hypothetical protein